jgi:hypothetical protein
LLPLFSGVDVIVAVVVVVFLDQVDCYIDAAVDMCLTMQSLLKLSLSSTINIFTKPVD